MIGNGIEFSELSERGYEQLSEPIENKNYILLNQPSMNDATLSVNGREVSIPKLQIPLLEYLMRLTEVVLNDEIIQGMYRHSRAPKADLRHSISITRANRIRSNS